MVVLDTIATLPDRIHGDYVFWEVVSYFLKVSEFTFSCFFTGKQVADLDIQQSFSFLSNEINFFTIQLTYKYLISILKQMKED